MSAKGHHFTGVHIHTNDCVFVRGVLQDLTDKRVPHSFVLRWMRGEWSRFLIHNDVTAQCSLDELGRKTFSLCANGEVHVDTDTGVQIEHLDQSGAGPDNRRWMWDIRSVGKSLYAVGMLRMVYKRVGTARWVRFNRGAEVSSSTEVDAGFRSIDGFSEASLYAVGLQGEIWQCDGQIWKRLSSPTNVRLDRVRCTALNLAYCCGADGTILKGIGSQWSVVEQNETKETFWDMVLFQNTVFFATRGALYALREDNFFRVDMQMMQPDQIWYLDANDSVLWAVGGNDIVVFDGTRWKNYTHPLAGKV